MSNLEKDIIDTCNRADDMLWGAYGQPVSSQRGHFVFPLPRGGVKGNRRVSEQEARLAYIEALIKGGRTYAVEAPTAKEYTFKNGSRIKRAAMSDLCVYKKHDQQEYNVEFKSGGVSPGRKPGAVDPVQKDLQKLLREAPWGVWFHLLRDCNNSTVANLVAAMNNKIGGVKQTDLDTCGISVHICVLEPRLSLHWSAKHKPGTGATRLPQISRGKGGVWENNATAAGWTVRIAQQPSL